MQSNTLARLQSKTRLTCSCICYIYKHQSLFFFVQFPILCVCVCFRPAFLCIELLLFALLSHSFLHTHTHTHTHSHTHQNSVRLSSLILFSIYNPPDERYFFFVSRRSYIKRQYIHSRQSGSQSLRFQRAELRKKKKKRGERRGEKQK